MERSRKQREQFRQTWENQHPLPIARRTGWVRTLIVEDHRAFRERLVHLLQDNVATLTVGEAEDGLEGVRKAEELKRQSRSAGHRTSST
jgi:hypothetical protein